MCVCVFFIERYFAQVEVSGSNVLLTLCAGPSEQSVFSNRFCDG